MLAGLRRLSHQSLPTTVYGQGRDPNSRRGSCGMQLEPPLTWIHRGTGPFPSQAFRILQYISAPGLRAGSSGRSVSKGGTKGRQRGRQTCRGVAERTKTESRSSEQGWTRGRAG